MSAFLPRTDLAAECRPQSTETRGITEKEAVYGRIREEILQIEAGPAEKALGKPAGTYTTYSFPPLYLLSGEERELLTDKIGKCLLSTLLRLTGKDKKEELSLLVVGLGNRRITADAVGAETAEKIHATAHIKEGMPRLFQKLSCASISLLIPGVLPQSGVDAAERAKALTALTKPDAVLAFDALFARTVSRLGRTVQIADNGIEPGGGIGAPRKALSPKTLGIPVVSVGVPTVTDTQTLVRDCLSLFDGDLPKGYADKLPDSFENFISPGDSDRILAEAALLLSEAVNTSLGVLL